MSNPSASLPTLIMLANAAAPSTGYHAPSLARNRNLKGAAAIDAANPLHLSKGEIPDAAGQWVTPVHTHGQDRQILNTRIATVNKARGHNFRVSYISGKAVLREHGKTVCKGNLDTLFTYLNTVPNRTPVERAFFAMGDRDDRVGFQTPEDRACLVREIAEAQANGCTDNGNGSYSAAHNPGNVWEATILGC